MVSKIISTEKGKEPWVDFLRSISIFLVIIIHTTASLAHKWGEIPLAEWMTGNFYNTFSRVSVPLLFMISGYLLLGRQEDIEAFYRKRLKKVVVPLLFWSVIYLVWANGYKDFTFINSIKAIIYAIITAPASYHLWFLYELLAIYLFVPILRLFIKAAEPVHLWYFAGLWLIFGPLQIMFERIVGFSVAIDLGFFSSYIGYFFVGYLLGKMEFSTRVVRVAAIVYILAGGYTMYATYQLTNAANDFVQYYYWYTRINIVLMSFSAFILLKKLGLLITSPRIRYWFKQFAEASFGIYLIHVLVLAYINQMGLRVTFAQVIFTVPLIAGMTLLISWGLVSIIQRIPVLREVTPK